MNAAPAAKSRSGLIALVGVVLIVIAIILVPLSVVLTTTYSDWWGVPSDETVTVTQYWPRTGNNSAIFGYLPMTSAFAVRIRPASLGVQSDRVYVAAGSRIYAIDPSSGLKVWPAPGFVDFASPLHNDSHPTISVDPLVVNYGSIGSELGVNYWLYAATASGNVYGMNDSSLASPSTTLPSVQKIGTMDGSATGLVAFSGDDFAPFTQYDMIAAGSSKGTVYFWRVDESGHHLADTISLGTKPIHMAGQPMHGVSPYPLFSPSFYYTSTNRTRPYLYIGSEDGNLSAIDIADLSDPRVKWKTRVLTTATSWTSAPVAHYVIAGDVIDVVVFAATDDSNLWALYANNGTPLPQGGGPVRIGRSPDRLDGGRFTQPLLEQPSNDLYVGSSSGYAYSVGHAPSGTWTGPVHVKWFFRDLFHAEGSTYVAAPLAAYGGSIVFVASNYDRGQPGSSPEDQGTLFALDIDSGTRSWYKSFESPILGSAVTLTSRITGNREVIFGTYSASVYAFDVNGLLDYGPSITCPDGGQVSRESVCTKQSIPFLLLTPALLAIGVIMIVYWAAKSMRIAGPGDQRPQ